MKFEQTKLTKEIKKALFEIGYVDMTSIQEKTLAPILDGKDIIAMSNTGTGKTAAFILPLIDKIDIDIKKTQILVLVPTRELAIQIVDEIRKFTKYKQSVDSIAILGGKEIKNQAISLRRGVKIVVGTPGRVLSLLNKKILKLDYIKALVLDEADEMLSIGFEEDIYKINKYVMDNTQKLLFSATITENVKNVAKNILRNPLNITCIENNTIISKSLRQVAIEVKEKMKNECTLRILKSEKYKNSIVFCNTKKKTLEVANYLKSNNMNLEMLNSDILQDKREKILKKLKNGKLDTIVVTDLLSRGIDINDLDLVINYDIPIDVYYYIHRIGRTARNGNKGIAYIFYTGKQINKLKEIEKFTNTKFEYKDIPMSNVKVSNNIDLKKDEDGYYLVKLNIGKNDSIKAKDIVGAFSALVGIKSEKIGKIEVMNTQTSVQIPEEYIYDVLDKFKSGNIKGIKVSIIYPESK